MSQGDVLDIMRSAIYQVIINSAPLLIVSLIIGLAVSILQTVTSIQEQTLTFVPKLLGIFIVLMIFGPILMSNLTGFIGTLWADFTVYIK